MQDKTHQQGSGLRYRRIAMPDISGWRVDAQKSGLTFCRNTELYGVFEGGEIRAFTGLLFYRNKVVFKNHYVLRAFRSQGYFRKILEWSISQANNRNIRTIEATCTPSSLKEYLNQGFVIVRKYKKVTKVRYENI